MEKSIKSDIQRRRLLEGSIEETVHKQTPTPIANGDIKKAAIPHKSNCLTYLFNKLICRTKPPIDDESELLTTPSPSRPILK